MLGHFRSINFLPAVVATLWLIYLPYASSSINTTVKVYDNVLPDSTRTLLLDEVSAWQKEGVMFEFPLEHPLNHSIIEQILNNIMIELYPEESKAASPKFYVEYWKRQEWHIVLAHADMDEHHGREVEKSANAGSDVKFKHPETGHVLYLRIGEKTQGPTVVFNRTFGGDLVSEEKSDMIVAPAVESRLLRFQGHLLHGVPRPADLWMNVDLYEPHPIHDAEHERSVLLFNTWPVDKHKLQGKKLQKPHSDSTFTDTDSYQAHRFDQWQEVKVVDASVDLVESTTKMHDMQVPLMGDTLRRKTSEHVAWVDTPLQSQEAFRQPNTPTKLWVQPKSKPWFKFWGIEF